MVDGHAGLSQHRGLVAVECRWENGVRSPVVHMRERKKERGGEEKDL